MVADNILPRVCECVSIICVWDAWRKKIIPSIKLKIEFPKWNEHLNKAIISIGKHRHMVLTVRKKGVWIEMTKRGYNQQSQYPNWLWRVFISNCNVFCWYISNEQRCSSSHSNRRLSNGNSIRARFNWSVTSQIKSIDGKMLSRWNEDRLCSCTQQQKQQQQQKIHCCNERNWIEIRNWHWKHFVLFDIWQMKKERWYEVKKTHSRDTK